MNHWVSDNSVNILDVKRIVISEKHYPVNFKGVLLLFAVQTEIADTKAESASKIFGKWEVIILLSLAFIWGLMFKGFN